ncbi:MAG: ribosome small subunit-dependent GTPase A [SAR324 cluster bacterium]|nr:ribosome small subunit-dependent GTPase A [SAR324 cluster bacterium]
MTPATTQTGLVLRRTKSFYYIYVNGKVCLCRVKGNLFQNSRYDHKIAVGDRVEVDLEASDDAGWIYKVLPRSTKLTRPMSENVEQVLVANADYLMVVSSTKTPPFRYGLVDRFLITAERGGLTPVIVINKIDLGVDGLEPILQLYQTLGYQVLCTSVATGEGLDILGSMLHEKITILSGHSGVGKSSIIKALFPDWDIRIGNVNEKGGKGKHTTTLAEMYPLPQGSGFIVDTPGIREMGLGISREELDQFFIEFETPRKFCGFKRCSHTHEPRCGVKEALVDGQISEQRYESYLSIFESLENK